MTLGSPLDSCRSERQFPPESDLGGYHRVLLENQRFAQPFSIPEIANPPVNGSEGVEAAWHSWDKLSRKQSGGTDWLVRVTTGVPNSMILKGEGSTCLALRLHNTGRKQLRHRRPCAAFEGI